MLESAESRSFRAVNRTDLNRLAQGFNRFPERRINPQILHQFNPAGLIGLVQYLNLTRFRHRLGLRHRPFAGFRACRLYLCCASLQQQIDMRPAMPGRPLTRPVVAMGSSQRPGEHARTLNKPVGCLQRSGTRPRQRAGINHWKE